MTSYVGSGPYCYADSLSMVIGQGWRPGLVETLTGSPFGFQMVGPLPLFDPVGWDPDLGLDQALALLGWACEREVFDSDDKAFERLARLAEDGPVFVGPLEMGLLLHQPGADRPIGADHFVAVLEAGPGGVTMHDPQGHPYAWLPREEFMSAWGSDTIAYGSGRFPLRTSFRRATERTHEEAVRELLPLAHEWARGDHAPGAGNAAGLRELADRADTGLGVPTLPVLQSFALRLGARRRVDAATELAAWPEVAANLDGQARALGQAQLAAVREDGAALAATFRQVADIQDQLVHDLARAT
ncbi:hypothetical protein [Nocardioides sp.]|uniref:hypothetical protein n=1 Tax=Nocardioides sp. TaxID=35761 RepID=UPI002ED54338